LTSQTGFSKIVKNRAGSNPLSVDHETSSPNAPHAQEGRYGLRSIRDVRQWIVTGGDAFGTNAPPRRTFVYTLAIVAVFCIGINTNNVLTDLHNAPGFGLMGPVIWEASSWVTLVSFFWIPWIGFRLAPPLACPRWRLLIHVPVGLAYSLFHVAGFVLLRRLAYGLHGLHYDFGPFWPNFLYEFRKVVVSYALFIASFTLVARLVGNRHRTNPPDIPATFDIRDGAALNRIRIEDVLAVASAGNYVEFVLRGGRRLTMRSSLSAVEADLRAHGFLRTHRSWLVNPGHLVALRPQGSGDYVVDLGALTVPLSRRFPAALAKLRGRG
jgi:hypothetical protein